MQRIYWPTSDWKTADPAILGMAPERLSELDAVIKSEYAHGAIALGA